MKSANLKVLRYFPRYDVGLLDTALIDYPEIWAVAGTPGSVFRMIPAQLALISGGGWLDIGVE